MILGTDMTVGCRLCQTATRMLGTQLCDRCYELESRIQRDPALAARILASIEGAHVSGEGTRSGRVSGAQEHKSNIPQSRGF